MLPASMLKYYLVEQGEQKKMLNSFYILCSKEDAELFHIFCSLRRSPLGGQPAVCKATLSGNAILFSMTKKREHTHNLSCRLTLDLSVKNLKKYKVHLLKCIEMYGKCPRKFHSLWKIIALDLSTSSSSGEKQTWLNALGTNVDLTLRQVKAAHSDIRFGGNKNLGAVSKGCAKVVVKDTCSSREHQSCVLFIDACVGGSTDRLCPYWLGNSSECLLG